MICLTKLLTRIGTTLVVLCGIAGQIVAVDFSAPKIYSTGSNPRGLVVADFNGDGKPDVAVINEGSGSVSILLGNGDGTFHHGRSLDIGGSADIIPWSIAAGDFNSDGKVDLVVANGVSVDVHLGKGDGTFGDAMTVPGLVGGALVADVNLDGKLDIISGNSVALGNGDGTFQSPLVIGLPAATLVADFNGDGKPDMLSDTEVRLGNGDGTFQPGLSLPELYPPCGFFCRIFISNFVAADFDGDGKVDLAVAAGSRVCVDTPSCTPVFSTLEVLHGNGDGTFGPPKPAGVGGEFLFMGDFNGDGKLDLGAAPTVILGSPLVYIQLGKGDGTFPTMRQFDVGAGPIEVFVADLNGDKLPDILATDFTDASISVLLNKSATSGADLSVELNGSPSPVSVTQNLTYDAKVSNSGPEDASDVVLTDQLPGNISFVSLVSTQGSCTRTNNQINCEIGSLVSGAAAEVTFVVVPAQTGTIQDTANVSAKESDPLTGNNQASASTQVDPMFALKIVRDGSGSGSVTSVDGKLINCGTACSATLPTGTQVGLVANPDAGFSFLQWSGGCTGTDSQGCVVTLNADITITASFTAPDFQLGANSASLRVARGMQATDTLSSTSLDGFAGTISLGCSVAGPPPAPACNVAPNAMSAGGTATLIVTAPGLSAQIVAPQFLKGSSALYSACLPVGLLGGLMALMFDKKRRQLWRRNEAEIGQVYTGFWPFLLAARLNKKRMSNWVLYALLLAASLLPVACGGDGNTKQPPQSYVVTVTGVAGSITHTVNVNITVGE